MAYQPDAVWTDEQEFTEMLSHRCDSSDEKRLTTFDELNRTAAEVVAALLRDGMRGML